jgi:Rieske 2Fe-2S family protein
MGRDPSGHLLAGSERTLPSRWYHDADHHRRELEAIWYRNWLCVGRAEEIARPRDFLVVEVGDQSIVVARDLEGRLRAFHNTCRHRGSLLCAERRGRFRGDSVVCPYHGWTYALSGELLGARHQLPSPEFRKEDHSLYRVAVAEWAGCLFVNLLGDEAPPLAAALGELPQRFANWHVEDLRSGQRTVVPLACNWKIFWENFSECFHCPGVHPELSRLVPAYGRGLLDESDDPEAGEPEGDPSARPRLAPGAVTWTLDGTSRLPALPGLTGDERRRGQSFAVLLPTMFLIAHVDYVRSVRVLPRGPEATELVVEWLFPPGVLERPDFDLEHAVALGRLVVEQDGRICELNQKGLHCMRHDSGVLVPQEYGVRELQDWVRRALGTAA